MAVKYGKQKYKQNNVLYTIVSVVLLCALFFAMVYSFYHTAEEEAFENLHMQTKQIKDDLMLQLVSDRENLATMANFAAKLYRDGETFDLVFESFKQIGLIENVGILTSDNVFSTKAGSIDLNGLISFEEEKEKGAYISGRIADLTRDNYEIIRSAVPVVVNGEIVGILYGVIKLERIRDRYNAMAKELDAQLFVYDKEKGDLVIDTVHDTLGNISFLKDRKYNDGYSYEEMMRQPNGFTSFVSAYRDENLYLHYSTMEEIGWMIALARYDSQVFADTHALSKMVLLVFASMMTVLILYMLILTANERRINSVNLCASEVRKTLLETTSEENHIARALKQVCTFAKARSAIFFDTNGEDFAYITPGNEARKLSEDDRQYLRTELFTYAAELHGLNQATVNVICITPNTYLRKTNPVFYLFLQEKKISNVSFAAVIDKMNYVTVLGVINSKRGQAVRVLAEKIAVCFSIALYNKNRLDRTELEATTDALTGVLNRVAYKNDLEVYAQEAVLDFACVYIDVNELHLRNNKYGHAAGDAMLICIANTLKDIFYGHKIYRMGGDEFLVFTQNMSPEAVKSGILRLVEQIRPMDYHVAVGMSYRASNTDTEEMIREAEVRMYEAKAQYYQNKEHQNAEKYEDSEYLQVKTGILEIDTMLSVMKEHYNGIYRVSLDTDKARRVLMPAYLGYNESEEHFSKLFSEYVAEIADPDYHRAMMSFLNYDAIRHQLDEGTTPTISYKKNNGSNVVLSIYKLGDTNEVVNDTLWVFEKK